MLRFFSLLVCLAGLAGCAPLPEWMVRPDFGLSPIDDQPGRFSFAWTLTGDQDVGPIQVFDNGRQTWLQFQPGQVLPAIFAASDQGERPVRYTRRDDYLVINSLEPALLFRGGQLEARATRQSAHSDDATEHESKAARVETDAEADVELHVAPVTASLTESAALEPTAYSAAASESFGATDAANPDRPAVAQALSLTNASFEKMAASPALMFSLRYDDATLRHALQRWARQAGWTFAPEHWAVDVDIPVSAEADFGTAFESAVQSLLAATELSDRPVQPCFYTNQVVRVVPFTQACDRGRGESS